MLIDPSVTMLGSFTNISHSFAMCYSIAMFVKSKPTATNPETLNQNFNKTNIITMKCEIFIIT